MKLKGKVAVITGGSSGIGLGTAKRFIEEGATVLITGRDQGRVDAAVAQLGPSALGLACDVTSLAALDGLHDFARDAFGRVDVLFANAGMAYRGKLGEVSPENFDTHFDTNVKGLFFTVQKLLPLMPNGAAIVLTGSVAHIKALPGFSVYCATKAAVRAFARSWLVELQGRKIRVNVVSPGPIDTPIVEKMGFSPQEIAAARHDGPGVTPLGRKGQPDEVADAVLFLSCDDSRFITGVELFVDGGFAQV